MRAILYAAGIGSRLGDAHDGPKALLTFGGESLLERHLRLLGEAGIDDIVIATGYRADRIADAVRLSGRHPRPVIVHNPDYRQGSIVTQWAVRDRIGAGGPVILMDADVLYDRRLLQRLLNSAHGNCFLLDRAIEPGEEPVKLCVREGRLVDFRKRPEQPHDWAGESVGFFKLTESTATDLVAATARYIETGRTDEYYDEALRDLLLAAPPGQFGYEDITGLPWTEIDFAEDVARAGREILPRLED